MRAAIGPRVVGAAGALVGLDDEVRVVAGVHPDAGDLPARVEGAGDLRREDVGPVDARVGRLPETGGAVPLHRVHDVGRDRVDDEAPRPTGAQRGGVLSGVDAGPGRAAIGRPEHAVRVGARVDDRRVVIPDGDRVDAAVGARVVRAGRGDVQPAAIEEQREVGARAGVDRRRRLHHARVAPGRRPAGVVRRADCRRTVVRARSGRCRRRVLARGGRGAPGVAAALDERRDGSDHRQASKHASKHASKQREPHCPILPWKSSCDGRSIGSM